MKELSLATPLSVAFHWIEARRRRLPRSNIPRLIEHVVRRYSLSLSDAQWLTWSLDPNAVALVSKEPKER